MATRSVISSIEHQENEQKEVPSFLDQALKAQKQTSQAIYGAKPLDKFATQVLGQK